MNQADVSKLVSQLRIKVNPRLRKFRNPEGPEGRLHKLRKTVTALIKHERIELNYPRADESRMYTERLISDAIRHGDCHKTTMEMADFWLLEKQLIHKLFKVLAPRYANYNVSYTRMYKAPRPYPGDPHRKAILELRGNIFPSLLPDMQSNRNLIHNVLLDEAKKDYRAQKYAQIAAKIEAEEQKLSKIAEPAEKLRREAANREVNEEVRNEEVTDKEVTNEEVTNEEVTNKKVTNKEVTNKKVVNKEATNTEAINKEVTTKDV